MFKLLIISNVLSNFFICFKITEELFVSVGKYREYETLDLNLPVCGLRYYPLNVHLIKYSSKCFKDYYKRRLFLDYQMGRHRTDKISKRIYLGQDVQVGEAPWTVYLYTKKDWFTSSACTGSLLTFEWVVTSAHCFGKRSDWETAKTKRKLVVWAGSIKPLSGEKSEANLDKVIFHPKFNNSQPEFDIAIFKLKKKFTRYKNDGQNYLINPICLPKSDEINFFKEKAIVFGFGHKSVSLTEPNLQKFTIDLDPYRKDNVAYYGHRLIGKVNGDKPSVCDGDSGGPLVQYVAEDYNRAVLAGVTWGSGPLNSACSHEKILDFFVPVSQNIDWILEAIKKTNNRIN